jgi:hypothetical protein
MMEEIVAALAALKQATDIAKGINALNVDFEVKTKTSELLSAIIDLQHSMLELQGRFGDLQGENEELKSEVSRLRLSASTRDTLQFKEKMYWKEGDSVPFCPVCLENEQKQIHLTGPHREEDLMYFHCEVCGNNIFK